MPFCEGMLCSNEPGCYNNVFGIRIENIIECISSEDFLAFNDLTMIPYDKTMIDFELLSDEEKNQIDMYHKKIYDTLHPYLTDQEEQWLKNAI